METTLNCDKVLQRIAKRSLSKCPFVFVLVLALMFTRQELYVKDLYRYFFFKSPSAELNCRVPDSN